MLLYYVTMDYIALRVPAKSGPLPLPGVGAVSEDSVGQHQLEESRASYGR